MEGKEMSSSLSMDGKEKNKHSSHQRRTNNSKCAADHHFKRSSDVKGIRFGGQFIVKSFTVRRAPPHEMLSLLGFPPFHDQRQGVLKFASTTTTYLPTNFTILAHHAWHTLTLGLGTKKSKVLIFVFESESMKLTVDCCWPQLISLGDVNRKLIRGLVGCEMARFKHRKGILTFYVYAVRRSGADGFPRADDLTRILEKMAVARDFLDHTALLAPLPGQRSIAFSLPVAMAH